MAVGANPNPVGKFLNSAHNRREFSTADHNGGANEPAATKAASGHMKFIQYFMGGTPFVARRSSVPPLQPGGHYDVLGFPHSTFHPVSAKYC